MFLTTRNPFSGLFNVARNPVSKHHMRGIRQGHGGVNGASCACHRDVKAVSFGRPIPHFVNQDVEAPMIQQFLPVRADATRNGLQVDDAVLTARLADPGPPRPIIIMIHGYRHEPGHRVDCPHAHIFSPAPVSRDPRVISWPTALGLDGRAAIGIAFGWPARGTIWGAYARAGHAGRQLAQLVRQLPEGRPVHIIAHSLGARVALRAISLLEPGRVSRVILLAAAELRRPARAAVTRATGTDIINICTSDNGFYDVGLSWIIAAGLDAGLGNGLGQTHAGWTDLFMDNAATRTVLARLGYVVAPARLRICHWSVYLRPGAFALYRALMTGALPLGVLRAHVAETEPAPHAHPLFPQSHTAA